jgi:hypothetical protein
MSLGRRGRGIRLLGCAYSSSILLLRHWDGKENKWGWHTQVIIPQEPGKGFGAMCFTLSLRGSDADANLVGFGWGGGRRCPHLALPHSTLSLFPLSHTPELDCLVPFNTFYSFQSVHSHKSGRQARHRPNQAYDSPPGLDCTFGGWPAVVSLPPPYTALSSLLLFTRTSLGYFLLAFSFFSHPQYHTSYR